MVAQLVTLFCAPEMEACLRADIALTAPTIGPWICRMHTLQGLEMMLQPSKRVLQPDRNSTNSSTWFNVSVEEEDGIRLVIKQSGTQLVSVDFHDLETLRMQNENNWINFPSRFHDPYPTGCSWAITTDKPRWSRSSLWWSRSTSSMPGEHAAHFWQRCSLFKDCDNGLSGWWSTINFSGAKFSNAPISIHSENQ